MVVGDTVRCPLHHACFSLRTGEPCAPQHSMPLRAGVLKSSATAFVREKLTDAPVAAAPLSSAPESILIVGGGAADRRGGHDSPRGIPRSRHDRQRRCRSSRRSTKSLEGLPGRGRARRLDADLVEGTYAERNIELVLGRRATTLDPKTRTVGLDDGTANLRSLADRDRRRSGATADSGRALPVLYLRSWADGRAIVERAAGARRVLVIGASFIGLEVSASLRKRGIEVDVVAPDKLPLERVMGAEIGRLVQSVHESNGVRFHLGQTVASVNGRTIMLSGGDTFDADFIVVGVGVRPALGLGEAAGLSIDKGIVVNEYLETSAPNVYAAGDNARWPDPHTGKSIRVEHWVVAQRQGQTAARNMLGRRERFDAVPFFWSRHFDMAVSYVGHAEQPRYAVSSYDGKELQGHLLAERQDRGGDDRRQRESLIARRLERT